MTELVQQKQWQRVIERALDNFKKVGRNRLTPATVRSRITSLKEAWNQFLLGHAVLVKTVPEAHRSSIDYFQTNAVDASEEVYLATLDYMYECLEELEPPVSPTTKSDVSQQLHHKSAALSLLHLPPIRLPPFDGTYGDWEHFRDKFQALIVNNSELNDFARMHFLTSNLKGRALETIANLPVTAGNFAIAWDALTARFENKRRLIRFHLSTLLDLAGVPRESANDLQVLCDKVQITVSALQNLQRSSEDLWNDILVHVVVQKLDPTTRKAWNVKSSDGNEPPLFKDLLQFLSSRARALEEFASQAPSRSTGGTVLNPKVHTATASAIKSPDLSAVCPLCKSRHYFSACPTFVRASPSQRRDLVKRHKRCFNCLSQSHAAHDCKSRYSCRDCHQRHHTMLHATSDSHSNATTTISASRQTPPTAESSAEISSLLVSTTPSVPSRVLLATAWIQLSAPTGRTVTVRALLDQGSTVTFVAENVAQLLRTKRVRVNVSVSAIGGVHAGTCRSATPILISPVDASSPTLRTNAIIMKTLTSYAPTRMLDISAFTHLQDLSLADPESSSAAPIQVIIGADLYNDIILDGLRRGSIGQPIAQRTIFGWVVSGPIDSEAINGRGSGPQPNSRSSLRVAVHHSSLSSSLEDELSRFWAIEELPRYTTLTAEDEQCEAHFRATHSRADDGRYTVRLPFKKGPPIAIGASRPRAEKCLRSLHRRLLARPLQASEYSAFLDEYEQLGHMRCAPVSSSLLDSQCVFIPHHPVYRDDSVTTHLRVVFNASSATTNGTSLNDHLLTGPKLQTDLPAVMLKWRRFKFVYCADIAKMYRQIQIDPRDRDYQRILWTDTSTRQSIEYQLLTVTYGMSAPFLALRVLQQLVSDEGSHFPLAVPILQQHIYVDDVLFGGDDIPSVKETRHQLLGILRRGGFELRKWSSNSPSLVSDINPANHGLAGQKSLSGDGNLKILGLEWHPLRDAFQFTVSLASRAPETKRTILSAIAKLYDPLGWVTPITITAKIFIQQLWKERLDWDDPMPEVLRLRWSLFYSRLAHLGGLRIARWTGLGADVRTELHGFADASNVAYAAAVYLKVISSSGKVTITLIAGKSRVAPLTPLTVPRLELSGAVLLARLLEFVRDSLNLASTPCFCWTDSQVVLAWLNQHPSRWQTFVANRVADIQARLPNVPWQHVSTEENPADCASRGLLGDEIRDHRLWWEGPEWLRQSHNEWPSHALHVPPLEEKVISLHSIQPPESFDLVSRYSSWLKFIRVTAYVFRFTSRCRGRQINTRLTDAPGFALSAAECDAARMFWIKRIQRELFPTEVCALSNERSVSSRSSISALRPFIDGTGILRVGGRLNNAPIPFCSRHPILLAPHPFTNLIIVHAHQRALHAGLQLTLSTLRRDYWILRARSITKAIIHRCVVCVRERATIPSQIMGSLPAVRVSAPTRSFLHCGVDYAGPVFVRASAGRGITSRKAYIALFVCLSTRAIHLELVSDYSTTAFINAYARFCSRRGLPQSVYSDNGTTFVCADKELTVAYRAAVRDPKFLNATASDRVEWHFIPPAAPHFGGIWEAGVRSVKHHLRRVLGNHTLTFEEFTTLLCRIEACLNSRPIAPLTDTLEDYEALTPGHFLIGSALTVHPEPSLLNLNENRLTRWQLVRRITERFWVIWYNDYVNTLQQRSKWRKVQTPVKSGQLVLVRNASLPPCKWELGRITRCFPGSDGQTRVIQVKTAKSEYKRPIVQVCVLPIDCDQSTPPIE